MFYCQCLLKKFFVVVVFCLERKKTEIKMDERGDGIHNTRNCKYLSNLSICSPKVVFCRVTTLIL